MRIALVRSGGFAGLVLAADVDADDLPEPLPAQARAVDWAALPDTAPGRPDGYVYAVEVTRRSGAQQRAVVCEPVPDELRDLLRALVGRAQPQE